MYSLGTPEGFSSNIKYLTESGLTMEEAKIAAMFVHYNYYDLSDINTVAWSYLISSVQFALKKAGLPVVITGGVTPAVDEYLKRIFAPVDWKTVAFEKIIQTIVTRQNTLAKELISKVQPVYVKPPIPWTTIAIAAGALIAIKVLL